MLYWRIWARTAILRMARSCSAYTCNANLPAHASWSTASCVYLSSVSPPGIHRLGCSNRTGVGHTDHIQANLRGYRKTFSANRKGRWAVFSGERHIPCCKDTVFTARSPLFLIREEVNFSSYFQLVLTWGGFLWPAVKFFRFPPAFKKRLFHLRWKSPKNK